MTDILLAVVGLLLAACAAGLGFAASRLAKVISYKAGRAQFMWTIRHCSARDVAAGPGSKWRCWLPVGHKGAHAAPRIGADGACVGMRQWARHENDGGLG